MSMGFELHVSAIVHICKDYRYIKPVFNLSWTHIYCELLKLNISDSPNLDALSGIFRIQGVCCRYKMIMV